ncbi:NAD(P)H-dependent oxidoreductase [Agarivorans aestuarii]|uniref:NAD(P)H-dependent oxidoreductase n=1 Tax=Agarivorans aestuarii TaxID=1563703 RepID=A0ABU7G599_9ALTE|nr:NAD(P)H-dependent oxidoreductase [Agarivorans aestuarii]MEE1674411.1 NAD(P)H-dependent oxidoreductase [Agarivorans aestuarii]
MTSLQTSKVAVVYFTKTDVTGTLAKALQAGLTKSRSIDVITIQILGEQIIEGRFCAPEVFEQLADCDAIIFGSPTYMGGVAAQFKAFADASSELWCKQQWAGKLAAGFTCGSALNGDQTSTLQYLVTLANQHGMLWVGLDIASGYDEDGLNRLGCQLGVVAQSSNGELHPNDVATAQYLGERIQVILCKSINASQGGYRGVEA